MDMDLPEDTEDEDQESFHSDKPMPNIWALDNDDNNHKSEEKTESAPDQTFTGSVEEDELEKPSFLRRLKKRKQNTEENTEKTDDNTAK
jgi:hypothetical protein